MFGCGENMTLYTCTGSPAFGLVKVCGSICIEWADRSRFSQMHSHAFVWPIVKTKSHNHSKFGMEIFMLHSN